jgi:hypothetical protein
MLNASHAVSIPQQPNDTYIRPQISHVRQLMVFPLAENPKKYNVRGLDFIMSNIIHSRLGFEIAYVHNRLSVMS